MKFSHTLSLNANPDWADHYIDYAGLKKIIHEVEAVHAPGEREEDKRRQGFLKKLCKMASGVRDFYDRKRAELDADLALLQPLLEKSSSRLELADSRETTPLKSVTSAALLVDLRGRRREICDMFTQYHELKKYAELNCTAVRKILKKFDKAMNDNLKETHLESVKLLLPFWDNTPGVDRSLRTLQRYFAHFYCKNDHGEALRQLQMMVREVVTYQRRSVWLDVIKDQRQNEDAQVAAPIIKKSPPGEEHTSVLRQLLTNVTLQIGIGATILFFTILLLPGIFDDDPTKRNCLALFVYASILWAAETIPLFCTSMLVPFLAVVLRVVVVDGVRLDAAAASRYVFESMFSHVIMLLLGGFSIAAAVSKHDIARVLANGVGRRCGSGVRTVVLVNMFIATGASMWISNVAAPVLCYSLIAPILKASTAGNRAVAFGDDQRRRTESDQRLCRALVMGIALASNIGGMASPISSPQNLFALEYTPIGWVAWLIVSIPLCTVLNVILWAWLIFCFRLPRADSAAVEHTLSRDVDEGPFTPTQHYVIIVSVATVLLWCASVYLEPLTGQMGILGIIPFVLFFGTGVLSKGDLNNFLWTVVILAMGGLVLGEAVKMSGLLDVMADAIADLIEDYELGLWATLCIFASLVMVCTTFVSHTVGAIVVIPIVQAVGSQMRPESHARELVFASALACSAAMGLPVSGFPNMTAVSIEDHLGNRFLTTRDFLVYAVPASVLALIVLVTVGYQLILLAVQLDA